MKKRFSLRFKLILIFGLLIALASTMEGLLGVRTARKAVTEKIETHLIDKADDVAEIIDGRINTVFQFIEGLARMPALRDNSLSFTEKARSLVKEAEQNKIIEYFGVCDIQGNRYDPSGEYAMIGDRDWFQAAIQGHNFIAEPRISRGTNKLQIILAVPIKDDNNTIIGVLSAAVQGDQLCQDIKDITVGKTGYCYILNAAGTAVAHKETSIVEQMWNNGEKAKTDPSLQSTADFEKKAIGTNESSVGYYDYNGIHKIASYAIMKTSGWTVIINAPSDR